MGKKKKEKDKEKNLTEVKKKINKKEKAMLFYFKKLQMNG